MDGLLFILIGTFIYIYSLCSSIIYGSSLFVLIWDFLHNKEAVRPFLSTFSEVPNLCLILFVFITWIYFPNLITQIGYAIPIAIYIAIILFIIRYISSILIYYKNTHKALPISLFISSFLAPMTLSYVYVYMLLGMQDYPLHALTLLFACLVILSLLLLSATFFQFHEHNDTDDKASRYIHTLIHESYIVYMLFLLVIPPLLLKFAPYMLSNGVIDGLCLILVICACIVFYRVHRRKNYLQTFVAAIALLATTFFSLFFMHYPYIIFPNTTFQQPIYMDDLGYILFMVLLIILLISSVLLCYRPILGRKNESKLY